VIRDLSRRSLLKGVGWAALGAAVRPVSLLARAAERAQRPRNVLLLTFLRGGADGLSLCAPYSDPEYYELRPTLALPRPRTAGSESLIDLDGHFGLHPQLAPLKPLYDSERLAILHGVGSPFATRSHFDAQEFIETGTPGVKGTTTGWLDRCLTAARAESRIPGVSFSALQPRSFQGSQPVLVTRELTGFDFEAPGWRDQAEQALRRLYGADRGPVGRLGVRALDAVREVRSAPELAAPPANAAVYPKSALGEAFRQSAQLIRADLGVRCLFVDVPGEFDTHSNQLDHNRKDYAELAGALAAFDRDLGRQMDRVVVLVVTEFGRTVAESGSAGTDHGSAGAMLVLGNPVHGGRVSGRWRGLAKNELYEERDLPVTTDFRDVFATVARKHLGVSDGSSLFPGYEPLDEPGILR
jgi:uncharacterized protein (DUF1501 family)